ncbi:DUF4236 domain-containing protein [Heliorestis convoluta]|uniref:DUF4236 domain-containing protein n=1 Tax=Heliorestis convoluta TaxID=356322 RepID=A0A5Q2MZX1_9FIRM|nr:DUF4236 domain-containing protein [Heliorestis convoluta]QGG46492.1 hypothetical protein FTV88_0313 [Heliorestis convoluta]
MIKLAFRFFKRIKLAPGVTMNLSKSGPSFSFGPRGMRYTVGSKGTRTTLGLPGTGLYYTKAKGWSSQQKQNTRPSASQQADLGFFRQMLLSTEEKQYLTGLQALLAEDYSGAYLAFEKIAHLSDGAFMCGYIAMGREEYTRAQSFFHQCQPSQLGHISNKINPDLELLLDVTEYIEAPIRLDERGLTLCLVEVYQRQGKQKEAIDKINLLWEQNPSDKVLCLSLVEIVTMAEQADPGLLTDVVEMTKTVDNDEPIDTNILYLRAYALYRLHLTEAAIQQLTGLVRKKKDRPESLLLDIRYLRGQMYEEVGKKAQARKDYEEIYRNNPSYGDIAQKLGLSF